MPFISSVAGSRGGRIWSLLRVELPTVVLSAATNYNQNRATLNATVSANGGSTNVVFQYDTVSTFNGINFTEVNASTTPITGQSAVLYANITGLSANTTYYFRCVASNSAGNTFSASSSFTTWSLKTYAKTTSGSATFTVPTITPTGGTVIAPSIYEVFVVGSGGGAGYGGGGAGGYYLNTGSEAFSNGANTTINISVGSGANGGQVAGIASSISGTYLTTRTANGGGAGSGSTIGPGGNSGNGYTGGGGSYGYNYDGKNWYVDTGIQGAGGGASYGANGNTYDGYLPANGQTGGGAYGYNGGTGGRAVEYSFGSWSYGTPATNTGGYGSGGDAFVNNAGGGVVTFKYYGP